MAKKLPARQTGHLKTAPGDAFSFHPVTPFPCRFRIFEVWALRCSKIEREPGGFKMNGTFLTVSEVARFAECSTQTVRNWEAAGKISAIRIGRGERLFPVIECRRFVEQRRDGRVKVPKERK
jgi:excisionase family DNA binding protein